MYIYNYCFIMLLQNQKCIFCSPSVSRRKAILWARQYLYPRRFIKSISSISCKIVRYFVFPRRRLSTMIVFAGMRGKPISFAASGFIPSYP